MTCEKGKMIRCVRCKGRKKLFFMNGGYTFANMGGVEKQCPMCLGTGVTKTLADALLDVMQKPHKTNDKDGKDAAKSTETSPERE